MKEDLLLQGVFLPFLAAHSKAAAQGFLQYEILSLNSVKSLLEAHLTDRHVGRKVVGLPGRRDRRRCRLRRLGL